MSYSDILQLKNLNKPHIVKPVYKPIVKKDLVLHLDGRDFINYPPTSSWKGRSVNLIPFTNIISNGDFSGGLTNWSFLSSNGSVSYNVLSFSANSVSGDARQTISTTVGHKIYYRASVKTDSSNVRILIYDNAETSTFHSGSNNFEKLSLIRTSTTASMIVLVRDNRSSNWSQVQVKDVLCVDLTSLFGAGNEPTKTECDTLFPFTATTGVYNKINNGTPNGFGYIKAYDPIVSDLSGTNQNVIEYSTGDGKVHYEIEGETLDIYSGGVKADFVGKQSGSVVENCNISKRTQIGANTPTLQVPSSFLGVEVDQTYYNAYAVLDNSTMTASQNVHTYIPQQLFSFDVIKTYERKFGIIPSTTQSVADKIACLKVILKTLTPKWYGYAICPSGYKAYFDWWRASTSTYGGSPSTHTASTVTELNKTLNETASNLVNAIDANGFVHFIAYTDMASTTSPTLLVLSGHGLVQWDIVENTTRGLFAQVINIQTNYCTMATSIANQASGDIIKKYRGSASRSAEAGSNSTTLILTNHGASTGDYLQNSNKGYTKVTVVNANTLTLNTPIATQIPGDAIVISKYFGQQTAESTVIPSTIYTDYMSLDIALKPSYKSVGEDLGGVGVHKVDVLSRGKNLFDGVYQNILGYRGVLLYTRYKCKPNTSYVLSYASTKASLLMGLGNGTTYSGSNVIIGLNTKTFTSTSDGYIDLVYQNGTYSDKNSFTNIQIEEGTTPTSYLPYTQDTKSITLAQPLRKVSSTVFDKYAEGVVNRNTSNWITLDGSLSWRLDSNKVGYKKAYVGISNSGAPNGGFNYLFNALKYDGKQIVNTDNTIDGATFKSFALNETTLYLGFSNTDSGLSDAYIPTDAEIKAYFNGWKMCHSDGVSPYQVSEVPYNPSTWAEWYKVQPSLVTNSNGVVTITADGINYPDISIITTLKTSTKYGILYNVVASGLTKALYNTGYAFGWNEWPQTLGNNKVVATTQSTITNNRLQFGIYNTEIAGRIIQLKDIRVFELPTGSQIETDFNTLTADQLTAKYMFYGLNPKNWKKITDGTGINLTLPTATYAGYTPYKMLYQLATPTIESITTTPINGFANGSLLVDGGVVPNKTNLLTSLLSATSGSWKPIDVDMPTLPNEVKNEVINGSVTQKVGKIMLNGNEAWGLLNVSTIPSKDASYVVASLNVLNIISSVYNLRANNIISDKFSYGYSRQEVVETLIEGIATGTNYIYISILKSKLVTQDLAGFKAYLQANPTTVYYELATPIVGSMSLGGRSSVETLNNTCLSVTSNILGGTPQIKVKFNIIDLIERKIGTLPCASDLTSKIAWVKGNVNSILCNDYIWGICSSGNKGYSDLWSSLTWYNLTHNLKENNKNTTNSPSLVLFGSSSIASQLDDNGVIHLISYTNPTNANSSGAFAPSTINMDYINLQVTFKTPSGSDGMGGVVFDGIDDKIDLGLNSSLFATNKMTIEFKITPKNVTATNEIYSSWGNPYAFRIFISTGNLSFQLRDNTATDIVNAILCPVVGDVPIIVSISFDYVNNTLTTYKDNILMGVISIPVATRGKTFMTPTTPFFIGYKQDTSTYANPMVNVFRKYNRVLNDAERTKNYKAMR